MSVARRVLLGALVLGSCTLALGACRERGAKRWVRSGDAVMHDVQRTGHFADPAFKEASGIVLSTAQPGVFWGNNDSSNEERLFAFDSSGAALGSVRVREVENRDWEALASGPCVNEVTARCLYVGDVGDNLARRKTLVIHAVREPSTGASEVVPTRSLRLRYSDGAHDVEAMYMGPDGTLWLVTKRPKRNAAGEARPARVYQVPASAWGQRMPFVAAVVDSVAVIPVRGASHDWITDASLSDVHPDGKRRLALLSYGAVHVFAADAASGRPERLLARCALPIRDSTAEGVSWLPDGRILLVTEGRGGALYTGQCP